MKLKNAYVEYHEIALDSLLKTLQVNKFPLTIKQLIGKIKKDSGIKLTVILTTDLISELEKKGYDIKQIRHKGESSYSLLRYGSFDKESYYKILGDVETPLIFASDEHIGSKGFSPAGWEVMCEDCTKYKIKTIICPGDFLQGLGVYRQEMRDVIEPDIDSQVDMGIRYLGMLPKKVQFHAVIGNHEEKIRTEYRVGFDPLKAISERADNFYYYGGAANVRLNKKYNILMIHGTGGNAYSVSYPMQKVWRELIEVPTILAMGHFHQPLIIPRPPDRYLIQCGTGQRENSWLMQKGITSQISWIVLNEISNTKADFIVRRPEVF